MSNLDIIRKLLRGSEVEWKTLGDVAEYSNTRVNATDLDLKSFVGVDNLLSDKAGRVDARYFANTDRLSAYLPGDILIGNIRPYLKKIWLATSAGGCSGDVLAIRILDQSKIFITPKFLYYVLSSDDFFSYSMRYAKGAKMPRGDKLAILNYKIPIPCSDDPLKSLEVQTEIVRILDTFTEVTSELTSELTSRKAQYAYYRDRLLSFEETEVEWMPLGEIGEFIRGKRFTKDDYAQDGIDAIHYGEIYTRYGVWTTHALSQLRKDLNSSLRYAEPGDVVITDVGETVEDVGKAVAWLGAESVAIHDHCYAFRHKMNPKYVSYCMQTTSFIARKAKYVARTKVNTLLINGFVKMEIPIPYPDDSRRSLEEQARIVGILDKFDTLIHSLSEGLPREIELRRKQYEYYRNLLLSFPKHGEATA